MSTLCGETLLKNYRMYNKNDELTGQNCICFEEDMITFFSTIKEGPGSNCCQFNPKSMTLFLSNPAFFLLLYIKTCKDTDKTSLSTNIKRTHSPPKKTQREKRNINKNRNKKYHLKPTNPPTNFREKAFQFSSLPFV